MNDDSKPLIEGMRPDETPIQAAHRMLDDAGIRDGAIDIRVASACALLDSWRRATPAHAKIDRLVSEVGVRGGARVVLVSAATLAAVEGIGFGEVRYHRSPSLQGLVEAVQATPNDAHVAVVGLDDSMAEDWLSSELRPIPAVALPTLLAERIDIECRSRLHSTVLILVSNDSQLRQRVLDALNELNPGLAQELG